MSRRIITKEFYDALVVSYAAHPGNAAAAGRAAGCDCRTAKRGWELGWPKYDWARPIKDVIAEQQQAARALAVQREAEQREAERAGQQAAAQQVRTQAMLDVAREREQDGQIARAAKQNALAAQATAMNLLRRGLKLSEELSLDDLRGLPVRDRVRALKVIGEFAKEATLCSEAAVKLERLILGEPTELVKHEHQHKHQVVPPAEMAATIARANAAVERARQQGLIVDTEVVESPAPH